MALFVHRSNRIDALADALVEVVREPLLDPLTPEIVGVHGYGVARWLTLHLARALGVWANARFPFARHLVEDLFDRVLGDAAATSPWEPAALTWNVSRALATLPATDDAQPLHAYLEHDEHGMMRWQLATKIAEVFDHYTIYRPQTLERWEQQGGEGWQPMLWRALVAQSTGQHFVARARAFVGALERGEVSALPQRLSLFGSTSMSPLFLELLEATSRVIDVHLFVSSPTREFWAEVRSAKEIARKPGRAQLAWAFDGQATAASPLLLASLGKSGRELHAMLESREYHDDERYVDVEPRSMLSTLQSDLLHFRVRGPKRDHPPLPWSDDDDSIAVHVAHTAMREVEILHDLLQDAFARDPSLQPHEVIVMAPQMDRYVPYVEAVFAADDGARPHLPVQIAGRSLASADATVRGFLELLRIVTGRLWVAEVLDLLASEPVRRQFDLVEDEIERIRRWVEDAGVRWGIDGQHWARLDQPAVEQHAWRHGLDRMLLGYALPGNELQAFGTVLGLDDIEGSDADAVAKLLSFARALFDAHEFCRSTHTVEQWCSHLQALASALLWLDDHSELGHRKLRTALSRLREATQAVSFDEPIAFAVIQRHLQKALAAERSFEGFATGSVTFCDLGAMHSIPYRVVCLLGVDGEQFPANGRDPSWSELVREPRIGDRNARDEDRFAFLSALLAAQQRFIVIYVGQSEYDNSPLPPSVVVQELLDTVGDSHRMDLSRFVGDDREAEGRRHMLSRIVHMHPAQAFSPRYFMGTALFSYDVEQLASARALMTRPKRAVAPFVRVALSEREREPIIRLEEFVRRLSHPSRAFLRARLRMSLGEDSMHPSAREPLDLHGLARWRLADLMLRTKARGGAAPAIDLLRAGGLLAPGAQGAWDARELERDVDRLLALARQSDITWPLGTVDVDITLGQRRIVGRIGDIGQTGIARVTCSRLKPKQRLAFWIHHLVLQYAGKSTRSVLVGSGWLKDECGVRLGRVPDVEEKLLALIDLYDAADVAPLPLIGKPSFDFARKLAGLPTAPADEFVDAYDELVFHGHALRDAQLEMPSRDAQTLSFEQVARVVFGPLVESEEPL